MAESSAVQGPLWSMKDQLNLAKDILHKGEQSKKVGLEKRNKALVSMLEFLTDPDKVAHMESVLIEHGLMEEVDRRCSIEFVPMNKYLREKALRKRYYNKINELIIEKQELQEKLLRAQGVKRAPSDEKL